MQFGLTETQQVLKNSAREFFPAECPIAEVRRLMETETAYDAVLWKKIADQGWCGILFPEEYDGLGLGMVELAAAMEEMGRALVPGPFLAGLLAGAILDAAASPEQKTRYLAPLCRGKKKSTLALLESSARWDAAGVQMKALDGKKMFVPDAAVADFLIVATRDAVVDPGNSARFAQRIRRAGGSVREVAYDQLDHRTVVGALASPLRGLAPVLDDVAGFVAQPR
jgi:alkylation response protein AidB-like acyl-CoA dehydrogenase